MEIGEVVISCSGVRSKEHHCMKFLWGFRPVGIPSSGDSVQWAFRVHTLLDAKRIMESIHPFSCKNFVAKMGFALSRPFGRSGMLDKMPKISLDHDLLMQKCQQFCNTFLNNQGFLMDMVLPHPSRRRPNINRTHANSTYE